MELDAGTFLLQLAAGGLLFCWVTTRRREVGIGYGWLLRGVYGVLALGGAVVLLGDEHVLAATLALTTVAATALALGVSIARRGAGVRGQAELRAERKARVGAMVGRGDEAVEVEPVAGEFPPALDLIAPVAGFAGLLAAAEFAGGPYALAAVRLVVGAAFLGVVSDAMLLGHWYLVQPGLRRDAVKELVVCTAALWPFEIAVFVIPTGMVQVFSGTVDDGYDGLLAWVWLVCAVTTLGLLVMTWFALKERAYSAVMAATGLLYLAILTAFGMDLIPRAVLSP
ncbi:MAG: hypothetical protein ABWZ15_02950 [Acidimicrobiia bacterium]